MTVADLFLVLDADVEVVITRESCDKESYRGKLKDCDMRYLGFEVKEMIPFGFLRLGIGVYS